MDAVRYQLLKRVVAEASQIAGAERERYLASACKGDPALREEADRFLHRQTLATAQLAPPLELPAPEACGPYRIRRCLGQGGMGTVYEAEAPSGDRVAVKILHSHLTLTPSIRERFVQEAELGRQVDHSAVVRTIDAGTADTRPYLVMELVSGKTLRTLLEELGRIPERLVREIAVQAARGLAAVHAAGIVHRDMKPENLLLTGDGRLRIMDLGVAKLLDASAALTSQGQFLGSLHYASPEQCECERTGPPSDLYSLGVVLYELITGQNPFRKETPGATLKAHAEERPRPVCETAPETSAFFSGVIETLLEKSPTDRFPSAEALATALQLGERGAWWSERRRRSRRARLPRILVRRESGLWDRDEICARFEAAWSRARSGKGGALLLEGEPGMGKTRLLDDFLQRVSTGAAWALYGAFSPGGGRGGLTDSLQSLLAQLPGDDEIPRLLRGGPVAEAFASLVRREAPAVPISEDAFEACLCDLARGLARTRPVLWILDDLQFASGSARNLAWTLARVAPSLPLLLVCATRPGPEEHPGGVERISLDRLSASAVAGLLGELFGDEDLATRLAPALAARSCGVPFFLLEIVRSLEDQGFLRRRQEGGYAQLRAIERIEVPSAVRDLVEVRLHDLEEDDRSLLDVCSVYGYEFDAEPVAEVCARPILNVLQRLADLERRRGLVRASGRLFRFDHELVQRALYSSLAPRLAEEIHGQLARTFARSLHRGAKGGLAHRVVHHALRGGSPEEARPHLYEALRYLRRSGRREEELELISAALSHEGLLNDAARCRVLLSLAACCFVLCRTEEQRAAADEALELADRSGDAGLRVAAREQSGLYFQAIGDFPRAAAVLEEALASMRGSGGEAQRGSLLCALGQVRAAEGRFEEAETMLSRARVLAHRTPDLELEARAERSLGFVLRTLGRHRDCRAAYLRSRAIARRIGDRRQEAGAEGNLGLLDWHAGKREKALRRALAASALFQEVGDRRGEAHAAGHLALLSYDSGHLGDLRAHLLRGIEIAREISDRPNETHMLLDLVRWHTKVGQSEEALALLDEAESAVREMAILRLLPLTLMRRARLQANAGRPAEAAALCEEALRSHREAKDPGNVAADLQMLGEFLSGIDPERAASSLDEAVQLVEVSSAPTLHLLAGAHRAALPGGSARVDSLLLRLPALERRVSLLDRMEARFLLWKATGGETHLQEAKDLLAYARDHAPAEVRDSFLRNVPLHREIAGA